MKETMPRPPYAEHSYLIIRINSDANLFRQNCNGTVDSALFKVSETRGAGLVRRIGRMAKRGGLTRPIPRRLRRLNADLF